MSAKDSTRPIMVHVDGPPDMTPGEVVAALVHSIVMIAEQCGRDPVKTLELAMQCARRMQTGEPAAPQVVTYPSPGGVS